MRASSLLVFRCYFELPSINKDFTSLHFTSLLKCTSVLSTGNGLGDPCDGDFDGDKVTDYEDACSINHHVTHTDFSRLQKVDLSPFESSSVIQPAMWAVDSTVRINY